MIAGGLARTDWETRWKRGSLQEWEPKKTSGLEGPPGPPPGRVLRTTSGEDQLTRTHPFVYFFLGLGAGIAVGLLWAPGSGEDTRKLIKSKARDGGKTVQRAALDVRDSVQEAIERGAKSVERGLDQAESAIASGHKAASAAIRSAVKAVNEAI